MFYFRNVRNWNGGCCCGKTSQPPGFGPPCGSAGNPAKPPCPPQGESCPPPKPSCPPEHRPGEKCAGEKHHDKDKKDCQKGERGHTHREEGKKEEKKPECREEHSKREGNKGRPEEKKQQCAKIQPCACNHSCQCTFNCPDLLKWALWSSGFFRCSQCEKSGWHHRIGGGSGFC